MDWPETVRLPVATVPVAGATPVPVMDWPETESDPDAIVPVASTTPGGAYSTSIPMKQTEATRLAVSGRRTRITGDVPRVTEGA
jgi:hypothetical protein